jgi:hypothetical protein
MGNKESNANENTIVGKLKISEKTSKRSAGSLFAPTFVMLVTAGIAKNFENYKYMRLAQPFVVAPPHCGKPPVQNGVSAQFCAKSVVGHVH